MPTIQVGLDVKLMDQIFVYFDPSCVRTKKDLEYYNVNGQHKISLQM